jgi:hypothetical protein
MKEIKVFFYFDSFATMFNVNRDSMVIVKSTYIDDTLTGCSIVRHVCEICEILCEIETFYLDKITTNLCDIILNFNESPEEYMNKDRIIIDFRTKAANELVKEESVEESN